MSEVISLDQNSDFQSITEDSLIIDGPCLVEEVSDLVYDEEEYASEQRKKGKKNGRFLKISSDEIPTIEIEKITDETEEETDQMPSVSLAEEKPATSAPKLSRLEISSVKYLMKALGLDDASARRSLISGKKNIGIDAWVLDKEKRSLYVYIFREGDDDLSFKDGLRAFESRGFEFLFGEEKEEVIAEITSKNGVEVYEKLSKMKSYIFEHRFMISQVLVHMINEGKPAPTQKSAILTSLVESIESKKYQLDDYFGSNIALSIEYRSMNSDSICVASQGRKTHRYPITIVRPIEHQSPNGEILRVGAIRLVDLLTIHSKMGLRFFSKNIRAGLSIETATNGSLEATFEDIIIKEKMDPEEFIFHHNGVSIAAESYENKRGSEAQLTEPRLLNGAQTVTVLSAFVKKWKGDDRFEKNMHILERILVLGKVMSSADPEFISRVTISNNRQNPVEPWDLRANEDIQLELQDKFAKEIGVFYERQKNSFAALTDQDIEIQGLEGAKKYIEMTRLAQTFLAFQGEIDKISKSRLKKVFESDSTFKSTFKESLLKKDAKRMILAYKIQFRINAAAKDVSERYPGKYQWLPKAKNLLWGLLIQALFNDENIDSFVEKFGGSLKIENDFTDLLKDLTSKKIRMILSQLIEDERIVSQLKDGNIGVLKTRAIFLNAMKIGEEKFAWQKVSI